MKANDRISTQGAFLLNCTPRIHQGMFVERRKLCLCSAIQFYKPNTQEVTRLKTFSITFHAELRKIELCALRRFSGLTTWNVPSIKTGSTVRFCCSESCFCVHVLRDPELSLSGIKTKQKVSPVISLLDCLS